LPPTSPERWRRVRALVEAALDRPPEERAAFLDAATGGDTDLVAEALRLLAAEPDAATLEPPQGGMFVELTDPEREAGRRIGPYALRRRIGVGGMGTVHLATRADGAFERQVAIKLVRPGLDSKEVLARFRRERQVLANLSHPGIAQLLDGGATDDDLPYLVLEYVDGEPIDRYCDENRIDLDGRLALVVRVCEAVQHAHEQMVVHRDLKPTNILVTPQGMPKLLDFGIAKVLDPEKSAAGLEITRGTQGFMTPAYASPEQVRGRSVTPASDVFSLGVVLYRLLTGHLPLALETTSAAEIERIVCEQEPARPSHAVTRPVHDHVTDTTTTPELLSRRLGTTPRELRRRIAGDLDHIVLKALRKEPRLRYANARELADDLERYRAGRPVGARRGTALYRAERFLRRNRLRLASAALALVAVASLFLALGGRPGAPSRPPLLAVLPVHSVDGDVAADALARTLGHGLPAVLVSSATRVLSTSFVADHLAQGLPASELEHAAGVDWLLACALERRAGALDLLVELRAPGDGSLKLSRVERDVRLTEVSALVARLGRAVRAALGDEERTQWEAGPSLSSAALSSYSFGLSAAERGDFVDAQQHFEHAIELDPEFALAHLRRAWALAWRDHGLELGEARAALDKALGSRQRLTPADRVKAELLDALIRSNWFPLGAGEVQKARDLVSAQPRDEEALELWMELAYHHPREGDMLEAFEASSRLLALDPSQTSGHVHRMFAAGMIRDRAAERASAEWITLNARDSEHYLDALMRVEPGADLTVEIRERAREARSHPHREAALRAALTLGNAPLVRELLRDGDDELEWEVRLALFEGRFDAARALLREAGHAAREQRWRLPLYRYLVGLPPVPELSGFPRWDALLGLHLASTGQLAEARAVLDELRRAAGSDATSRRMRAWLEGELLAAEGDVSAAAAKLAEAAPLDGPLENLEVQIFAGVLIERAARALLAAGRPDEAAAALARIEDDALALRGCIMQNGLWVADLRALETRARLCELEGRRDAARALYEEFLGHWSTPDASFPEVARALERYRVLAGEDWRPR
jgi:serine/threonine protein kinase